MPLPSLPQDFWAHLLRAQPFLHQVIMKQFQDVPMPERELSVSFGYQCSTTFPVNSPTAPDELNFSSEDMIQNSNMKTRSNSFSCLSGAALSANATLANTNICNGLIGDEILPSLDSPKSFRRMASSPSLSWLDPVSSSSHNSLTTLCGNISTENDFVGSERNMWKSMSAPTRTESSNFLNSIDIQMAGGAAGEDRVQAVCSEENGWLYCGIYDGFNGRDAADYLAVTLYENICFHLSVLEWPSKNEIIPSVVINCLINALAQTENDFMRMVEQEMEDRPDLVSVGSCVLVVLLHGNDINILNLGDSRAVLATNDSQKNGAVKAIQLTETHNVDNELERRKVLADHPDDPSSISNGRVKGKLKLTRAFGVGYLKKSEMNDVLMGILRIRNLCSPPYVYAHPFTLSYRVSEKDQFFILGSDGLFDFFSNHEVVQLVHIFIHNNPSGNPAKHLVEQLVQRAAHSAGFSTEELMRIPAGRRRKYHDDITVIVIIIGNKQRTSTASTSL